MCRTTRPDWRQSLRKRAEVAAIAGARLSRASRPWLDVEVEGQRRRARRGDPRPRAASHSCLLARPHPPGHALLSTPRHRRDHQRKLRRRVDRADHHEVRLRHRARLDVARRAEGAAAAGPRREVQGRGVHARRSARAGGSGAAGRGLAGEGDRQSTDAVSRRSGVELDDEELGPHADSQAVHDRGAWRSRSRCMCRADADEAALEEWRQQSAAVARRLRSSRCAELLCR